MQQSNEAEVAQQQASFMQQLQTQDEDTSAMRKASADLKSEIQSMESRNAGVREHANQVKADVDALRHSVEALSSNLTDARNFAEKQLRDHKANADASELAILRELDEEDTARGVDKLRQEHMQAIETADVSFLQVSQERTAVGDALEERLKALRSQHIQNIEELTAQFKDQYRQGAAIQQTVMKEREELNDTKVSLLQHGEELTKALSSLERTEAFLGQRESSLRGYFAQLGKTGTQGYHQLRRQLPDTAVKHDLKLLDPSAPVFLQVASAAHRAPRSHRRSSRRHTKGSHRVAEAGASDLHRRGAERLSLDELHEDGNVVVPPEDETSTHNDAEGNPGGSVFESVSSKVKNLEAQLEEAELENKQTLAKHQVQYEQNLNAMRDRNLRVARANAKLVSDITGMKRANQAVRDRAEAVRDDTNVLRNDLSNLRTNLSAAIEFTAGVLEKTAESHNQSSLAVLDELKQTEESRGAIEEHAKRLAEIAATAHPSKTVPPMAAPSFLQTAMVKEPPKALLSTLTLGFEELKKEHEKAEAELKTKFRGLFNKEQERYHSLLSEQKELNTTKQSLDDLGGRLRAALAHLESTRKVLEERGRSLRVYAQRLGIRPFPHQRSVASDSRQLVPEDKGQEDVAKAEDQEAPVDTDVLFADKAETAEEDSDPERSEEYVEEAEAAVPSQHVQASQPAVLAQQSSQESPGVPKTGSDAQDSDDSNEASPSFWSALFGR